MPELSCIYCSKIFLDGRSCKNHIIRCPKNHNRNNKIVGKGRPITRTPKLIGPPTPKNCEFCDKCYPYGSSTPAYKNHTVRCPSNPNKFRENLTPEGRKKQLETLSNNNLRWDNDEERVKQSQKMREVAANNPESYSHRNIGRGKKQVIYKGIKFDNNWELDFYKWCESKQIKCERNVQGFEYEFDGKRTYYPDFYLSEYDVYTEVKGQETDRDRAKWNYFPEKLFVIKAKEIKLIRKDQYKLPEDVIDNKVK